MAEVPVLEFAGPFFVQYGLQLGCPFMKCFSQGTKRFEMPKGFQAY